jgi:hypothetical protein
MGKIHSKMPTLKQGNVTDNHKIIPLFRPIRRREQRAFLAGFLQTGRITKAAELAGIHYTTHFNWMKRSKAYAEAFEEAKRIAGDLAEDEIYRRAFEGYDHPVTYKGKIKAHYKAFSDILAMFFLKGLRPEKYRDSSPIPVNGPTQFNITFTNDHPQQQRLRAETERLLQSKVTPE